MIKAFRPKEYDVVQAAFKWLAQSEWFGRTSANERDCANFVLLQYGDGGMKETELRNKCRDLAMERLSRRHEVAGRPRPDLPARIAGVLAKHFGFESDEQRA